MNPSTVCVASELQLLSTIAKLQATTSAAVDCIRTEERRPKVGDRIHSTKTYFQRNFRWLLLLVLLLVTIVSCGGSGFSWFEYERRVNETQTQNVIMWKIRILENPNIVCKRIGFIGKIFQFSCLFGRRQRRRRLNSDIDIQQWRCYLMMVFVLIVISRFCTAVGRCCVCVCVFGTI